MLEFSDLQQSILRILSPIVDSPQVGSLLFHLATVFKTDNPTALADRLYNELFDALHPNYLPLYATCTSLMEHQESKQFGTKLVNGIMKSKQNGSSLLNVNHCLLWLWKAVEQCDVTEFAICFSCLFDSHLQNARDLEVLQNFSILRNDTESDRSFKRLLLIHLYRH
jgi:hypothetical protein